MESHNIIFDFDFSKVEVDKNEQKHIPSKRNWTRLFWGSFGFKISGADFGAITCLLETTNALMRAVDHLVFLGDHNYAYSYLESAFWLRFEVNDQRLTVTGAEHFSFADESIVAAADCELFEFATAVGRFHKVALEEAVARYPGLLITPSFINNCRLAAELFGRLPTDSNGKTL